MHNRLFGLVGKSLSHSFSKDYFTKKFLEEKIQASYENFELPDIQAFKTLINDLPLLAGLNVTIPYKESIMPLLDKICPVAAKIGAVNTIKISQRKCIGYNTDYIGFQKSLAPLLKAQHLKALVLGTGGAAKAVHYALDNLQIEYKEVSRTPLKNQMSYNDLNDALMQEYKIIVNTTPLGMFPNLDSKPNLNYDMISTSHLLYDLVYNPEITAFLQAGLERGAVIKNGAEMLQIQAEEAWKIWNDIS